jgi:XapX domain-containing protein
MKIYLISLAVGLLVGVIYGLFNVRSPAPPVIALVGLLGILLGEQAVPIAKRLLVGHTISSAWQTSSCDQHVFGAMTGRGKGASMHTSDAGNTVDMRDAVSKKGLSS